MNKVKDIYTIYEEVLSGELRQFPQKTWTHPRESKDTLLKLVRYLVHERFRWNRQQFCDNFCYKIIIKFRLNTGFHNIYSRNIFPLITDAFLEWDVKAWELKKSRVPADFWIVETAVEATKWLVEERLAWSLDKVQTDISNSYFLNNNLGGMLRTMKFGAVDSIVLAYPDHDWTYLIERAGYKLTKAQVKEIRQIHASGLMNQRQIAKVFDVSPAQINLIIKRKVFQND